MPMEDSPPVNPYFVGVDGCRGGWLAVRLTSAGRAEAQAFAAWAEVRQAYADAAAIAVDMPIGLVDFGRRPCDAAARQRLGRRGSSVFSPPRRPMLGFAAYADANDWGKAQGRDGGGGVSKQAWNLARKIREIDDDLCPDDQDRIVEAHPELSFQDMAGGSCPPPKKSAYGQVARARLLGDAGVDLAGLRDSVMGLAESGVAFAIDDVYDACAVAITARRKTAGNAVCLGGEPVTDSRGLRMEIWY